MRSSILLLMLATGCMGPSMSDRWVTVTPPQPYLPARESAATRTVGGLDLYIYQTAPTRPWEHIGYLVKLHTMSETSIAREAKRRGGQLLVLEATISGPTQRANRYMVGRYID